MAPEVDLESERIREISYCVRLHLLANSPPLGHAPPIVLFETGP